GNGDTFGVSWSENLPDAPSFSAGFQTGSNKYSIYGTGDNGNTTFRSVNLRSGYTLAGFNMGAYYTDGSGHALVPAIVSGASSAETHSDNNAYGFNVMHLLPLNGSVSAGVNRSAWNSDYLGTSSTGAINMVNTYAAVRPANNL